MPRISRDKRIDSIKGFLIILVVFGHLIGLCGTNCIVNDRVLAFIYTFHMPLFVLLSGYFTKIKSHKRFWQGIINIALPLGVFQLLSILFLRLFHEYVGLEMLLVPYWTLWYLLSLIFWRIILQYSPKFLTSRPVMFLSIAFVSSMVCGLMPNGRILSIQRTINFFPFFLYGYYMGKRQFTSLLWSKYVSWGFLFLFLLLITFGLFPNDSLLFLKGADHYSVSRIPIKMYLLLLTFVVSVSVFTIVRENKVLAAIGSDSLFFYLYHGFIIRFVVLPLMHIYGSLSSLSYMIILSIFILALIYAMSRISFFRWLTNPLSSNIFKKVIESK